ncbi:uncharacterized protein LOC123301360 [Chrysoperla carnea]|uniref:uncharacterized protein LOC123301360 n=1 Tax=Chrysoperla carnea TaxID=189513 RepID=UPI001D072842|nr:uncharacterized protein LOC123301360 [Chrysoperla carnea]
MDKETLDELWTNLGAQLEGTSNLIQETNVVLNQISEATLHNTNQISELNFWANYLEQARTWNFIKKDLIENYLSTSQLTIAKDRFVNRRQKDDETFSSFITDITKYAKLLQPESTDSILTKTPGRARNFEYTIFIKDNEPIHKTPYYLPPDKEILLKNHINELNIQEHHKHLQIVLARFKKLNLTINPNKAKFFMQRLKILGHVISSEGRIPNPEKVEAIRTMPIPKNLKELQSFLGMAAFFARYIQNFSTIVAPLNALKKKDAKFIITQTHVDAINKLKTVLTTAPILRFPIFDDKHPFIVTTDASSIGVGACLMQKFENKLHPIEYRSRKLNPAESKYPVYQLELLAVLHALNTFKDYLLDRKFILRTDCNALVYLFNTPQRFNKLSRWLLTISKFNFTTEHIRGTENVVADCLTSPAAVFLGRTWNQPLDLLLNTTDILAMEKPPSVDMIQQALHKATVMRKARQHQAPTDVKFHVNQLVRVRLTPTASNINEDRKFSPRFSDVKRIVRFTTPVSVELIDPKTNELTRTHVTHLKRAEVL